MIPKCCVHLTFEVKFIENLVCTNILLVSPEAMIAQHFIPSVPLDDL